MVEVEAFTKHISSADHNIKLTPPRWEEREGKDHLHSKTCGYPNWAFLKSTKSRKKKETTATREYPDNKRKNIFVPYVSGLSGRKKKYKHDIPAHLRPLEALSAKTGPSQGQKTTAQYEQYIFPVQCREDCPDLNVGETKQPLHRHNRPNRPNTEEPATPDRIQLDITAFAGQKPLL